MLPRTLFRRRRGRIAVAGPVILLLVVVPSSYSPSVVTWDSVWEEKRRIAVAGPVVLLEIVLPSTYSPAVVTLDSV